MNNIIVNNTTNKKAQQMSFCQISNEYCLPNQLVYIDTRKQRTQTIHKRYFDYFNKDTDKTFANHILTLATYGDCEIVINNNYICKYNFKLQSIHQFELTLQDEQNNNINIKLYGHYDEVKNIYKLNNIKGFTNILTNYKDKIIDFKMIDFVNGLNIDILQSAVNESINPVKLFIDYMFQKYHLYYNTNGKTTLSVNW